MSNGGIIAALVVYSVLTTVMLINRTAKARGLERTLSRMRDLYSSLVAHHEVQKKKWISSTPPTFGDGQSPL